MSKQIIYSIFFSLLCSVVLHCTFDTTTTGSGTVTDSGGIAGILYDLNGNPVEGADVVLVPVDKIPSPNRIETTVTSSVQTDSKGCFSFSIVPPDTYNVIAKKNSDRLFHDSVNYTGDNKVEIVDTLRPSGSMNGTVVLVGGEDVRTVMIFAIGTQMFTVPENKAGFFTLKEMAQGTYHVRFLSTLDDYDPLDVTVTIKADVADTLCDTLYLPYNGIPIPTELSTSYDTLMQIVTVIWNQVDTNLIKGYNVYRKHSDSDFVKINITPTSDTVYRDSTPKEHQSYDYKIRAVDKNDEIGMLSKATQVNIVSAFVLIDSFTLQEEIIPSACVLGNDSLIFLLDQQGVVMAINTHGVVIDTFGQGMFTYPTDISLDSKGNIYITDPKFKQGSIVKFSKEGDSIAVFPLNFPSLLTIDKNDNIYVVYQGKDYTDIILARFDTTWNRLDSIELLFGEPGCLHTTPDGCLFLSSKDGSKINEYSIDLSLINSWNVSGLLGEDELMAVDKSNNFYTKNKTQIGIRLLYKINVYSYGGSKIARFGHYYQSVDIDMIIFDNFIYILEKLKEGRLKISIFSSPF